MASVTDQSTDRNRNYRKNVRDKGGAHIGVVLKPGDEATLFNRLAFEHGGPTHAIRYLLRQEMNRGENRLTDDELVREVAARLRSAGAPSAAPGDPPAAPARRVKAPAARKTP